MQQELSAIIDFGDVLSIADPTVRAVLESDLLGRLSAAPYRVFRLTPRVMVLLFDKPTLAAVTDALRKLERELKLSHSGRLDWKIYELRDEIGQFRIDCRTAVDAGHGVGYDDATFRPDNDRLGALLHIIESLRNIDLAPHMREQAAVRIDHTMRRTNEFVEVWVSLEDLELAIGVPIRTDPWRYARVTEFLDFRVMDHVLHTWRGEHVVSLNLHCGTVMQRQFDDLALRVNPAWRQSMIFELALSEMIDQRHPFMAAVRKLHEGGFRVALDAAVWPAVFQASESFDRFEFAKIPWTDAFAQVDAEQKQKIRALIDATPKAAFVLNRCGRPEDVDVGRALGFEVFQGWGVPPAPPTPRPRIY